ncbi:hypothetical protein ACWD62_44570 [Streptomyces sp. NPDC005146]|uniref:hypothetical protein n=1 Tax=Streptomyces sp. NPDC096068 TaxID=3155424 RepID=UPI003326CAF9
MSEVRGADVEIIERRKGPIEGGAVILPNHVRINGTSMAIPADSVIQISNITDGEPVTITITVFARSISIRAEDA